MHRKSTLLVLFAVLALFATAAQAQLTYRIDTNPTAVINVGRAETLGSVRLTSVSPAGSSSVASTIQVLYNNIQCDNNITSGVTLVGTGVFQTAAPASPTAPFFGPNPVQNTPIGCTVTFSVPAGASPAAPNTDYIEIQGVRGRVDLFIPTTNPATITASVSATPASASVFSIPSTGVVGTVVAKPIFTFGPNTELLCQQTVAGYPTVSVTEGYVSNFVQYVAVPGYPVPADTRPPAGAINNTEIRINVTTLPSGTSLTWPGDVVSGAGFSHLVLMPDSTQTSAHYTYATTSQGSSDTTTESFTITPVVTVAAGATPGAAGVSALLNPPLITGDATPTPTNGTAPTAPFGPAVPRPRFNDTPTVGSPWLTIAPCTTNLLFPYVATQVAGYETGVAISNSSTDPWSTPAQAGKCHVNYYPAGPGAVVKWDTANVASGDTITFLTSTNASTIGTVGYMIVICDFQYGHGLAYLVNSFGQTPNTSIGYLALVIPDPVIIGLNAGTGATRVQSPATCSASPGLCISNTGENLGQ